MSRVAVQLATDVVMLTFFFSLKESLFRLYGGGIAEVTYVLLSAMPIAGWIEFLFSI